MSDTASVELDAIEVDDRDRPVEEPQRLPVVRPAAAPAASLAETRSIEELVQRHELIGEVMRRVMREGHHYGVIPGTDKPALLKPGAEVLCQTFMLAPTLTTTKTWVMHDDGDADLDVEAYCTIVHIPTGAEITAGVEGFCSTREEKYGLRQANHVCPSCGAEAVLRSKRDPEWFCWGKRGGCGATFPFGSDGAVAIEQQDVGKKRNEKIADTYNTVVKMAQKRALVAAVLIATGASDTFTQDIEEHAADAGSTPPRQDSENRDTRPRTTNGQDTRQPPAKVSDAQVGLIGRLVQECRDLGYQHDDDDFAAGVIDHYKLSAPTPEKVQEVGVLEATVRLLTGGKGGQASNLIERLQTLKKNLKEKQA